MKKINDHNKKHNDGLAKHSLDLNAFGDWVILILITRLFQSYLTNKKIKTSEEFMSYVNKGLVSTEDSVVSKRSVSKHEIFNRQASSIPSSIDWRDQGIVTPVKNQGRCGSCWAFSALGPVESAYAKATGVLKDFSAQQLVDCVYTRDV